MKPEKNTKTIILKTILMKNYSLAFAILMLIMSHAGKSQDAYPLHPSVGDTLDLLEKLDYSLFPFAENTDFNYGVIRFQEDHFELHSSYVGGDSIFSLSQEQLVEAQQNIEKINAYYRLKAEEAKKPKEEVHFDGRPTGKKPVFFNESTSEQIRKEARMNMRLQDDAQRMLDNQRGIQQNQLRIEFK